FGGHVIGRAQPPAGTRGADVTIPGLPIEYAEQLRDRLKNVTPEDEV
ncbi:MAG: hypothetical protein IAE98_04495, partial [Candidatus Kapabacteria bacterium]|nr:hypothetical protein [Candidatus Kapabacteria bacterium]